MPIIGQRACQAIGDCAASIDPEAIVVYPDGSIVEAVESAPPGSTIFVEGPHEYQEDIAIDKALTLSGRCPVLVTLRGALSISANGPVTVAGMTVTGGTYGISVVGRQNAPDQAVTLGDLVVRDTDGVGIRIESPYSPLPASVVRTLVTRARGAGVESSDTDLVVEDLVVQDTASGDRLKGEGLRAAGGTLSMTRGIFLRNHVAGIRTSYVDALPLDQVVVRDTQPADDGSRGYGADLLGANVHIQRSLFAGNRTCGVFCDWTNATLEGLTVKDTQPQESDGCFGRGIEAAFWTVLAVRDSLIAGNHEAGIRVGDSWVKVERTIVRDTLPLAGEGCLSESDGGCGSQTGGPELGDGIVVVRAPHECASLEVKETLIQDNTRVGVYFANAPGRLVASRIVGGECEFYLQGLAKDDPATAEEDPATQIGAGLEACPSCQQEPSPRNCPPQNRDGGMSTPDAGASDGCPP